MDRPCLNPSDRECPSSAPNKASGEVNPSYTSYSNTRQHFGTGTNILPVLLSPHPFRVPTLPDTSRVVVMVSARSSCTGRRSSSWEGGSRAARMLC